MIATRAGEVSSVGLLKERSSCGHPWEELPSYDALSTRLAEVGVGATGIVYVESTDQAYFVCNIVNVDGTVVAIDSKSDSRRFSIASIGNRIGYAQPHKIFFLPTTC